MKDVVLAHLKSIVCLVHHSGSLGIGTLDSPRSICAYNFKISRVHLCQVVVF